MTWHPMYGYQDRGTDLTDPRHYESARQPYPHTGWLPAFAFQSKIFADLEDEKVWTRNWVGLGSAQKIPAVGDMLPFTVGHHGIHVQREPDGGLIGRFNFAQHGGCRSIPGQCQTGKKTKCSYTSCGYSHDRDEMRSIAGESTPEMAQYLGPDAARLNRVRVHEWGPLVLVNLDSDSALAAPHFAALEAATADYFAKGLSLVASNKVEVQVNWKTAGLYFLSHGHASVQAGPLEFALDDWAPPGSQPGAFPHLAYSIDTRVPVGRSDERVRAWPGLVLQPGWVAFCWIYPNVLISFHGDHMVTRVLQATGPAACVQRVDIYAVGAESAPHGQGRAEQWMQACAPDLAGMKALQQTLTTDRPAGVTGIGIHSLVDAFQQHFLTQVLAEHTYYINKPLYSAPGRALNAGR